MITLTPERVRERFGRLFARRYLVMVDERRGLAEILENCHAHGTIEWDAANRMRAGGAVLKCSTAGASMTVLARLGHHPVRFGAADRELGGQALEGVEVNGDEVVTSWAGMAGAGVGIAACLPQAPGVLRVEYPSEDDLLVGGARVNRARIVSPRYEKITLGIDDTDTKTEGATWVLALRAAEACAREGVELLNMRLIQLNPKAPKKTTNCVASALNFAVRPGAVDALLSDICAYIEKHTHSADTGIALYRGIGLPTATDLDRRVKTEILTLAEAEAEAKRLDVGFLDGNGRKGRIGALGAVLWANRGAEAAALYGEHL
ncbi:MAG: tRNA(Ile2) 2-agmatinylcytidine synthetase [Methanomicrobiales archaeon]|nr:tRNA(Ile2) 2-agmatinylcytidine synthetase [Methanomicrobiales archaeon]